MCTHAIYISDDIKKQSALKEMSRNMILVYKKPFSKYTIISVQSL